MSIKKEGLKLITTAKDKFAKANLYYSHGKITASHDLYVGTVRALITYVELLQKNILEETE